MIRKLFQQVNKVYFIGFILLSIIWLNSKPFPILIDEYASTFLASGIPTSESGRRDKAKYENITPEEILENNTLWNTYKNTIYDGGNGLFYYALAHVLLKTTGPVLGVFESLRLLSIVAFSVLIFTFYYFIKKEYGENHAFLGSLILIFTGYEYGLFVRFYIFCCLFLFIMYYKIYRLDNKNDSFLTWLLLTFLFITLPHLHFFSVLFVAFAFVLLLAKFFLEDKNKYLLKYLGSIAVSGLMFMYFYKFLNHEGRLQRASFDHSWHVYAQKYPSPANNWLAPTSFETVIREDTSLLLNFFGLDFYEAYPGISLLLCSVLLLIPLFVLIAYSYKKAGIFSWLSITLGAGFFLLLNLMRISSKYLVALNFHWYYFIILPFLVIWLTDALLKGQKKNKKAGQLVLWLYIGLLCFNTYSKSIRLYQNDSYYSEVKPLFLKIERQFDHKR